METIDEIGKKLANYENQYILENKSLLEKLNIYSEREKQYKDKILELSSKLEELNMINENNLKKCELNNKIIEEENYQLKKNYNTLKNNFDLIKRELNSEISKNELLIDKYNKLSDEYTQLQKENISLQKNTTQSITSYQNENLEKDKLIFYCNNTISILIKWIETNLISFYDSSNINNNLEVNQNYNSYINIDKNEIFIFDKLRDSLLLAKDIIDEFYLKINIDLKKGKENIFNIDRQNNELNNYLINLYHHLYEEINKEKYFDMNIGSTREDREFYFSEIEYMIDNIFSLLKKIKESTYNKSLDKLIEDNITLNKEVENYKSKLVELYEDNKIILDKNNELLNIINILKQQISNNKST